METGSIKPLTNAEKQKNFEEKLLERQKQLEERKREREEQKDLSSSSTSSATSSNMEIWTQIQNMKKSIDFDNDDNDVIITKWKQLQQYVNLNSQKLPKYDLQKAQSVCKFVIFFCFKKQFNLIHTKNRI